MDADQNRLDADEWRVRVRRSEEQGRQHYDNAIKWRDRALAAEATLARVRGVIGDLESDDVGGSAAELIYDLRIALR
jgi:hypothetical protein